MATGVLPTINIQVYQTDLTSFPEFLDWSSVLEQSNLTQVPAFLLGPLSPHPTELLLSGNAITQVPADQQRVGRVCEFAVSLSQQGLR